MHFDPNLAPPTCWWWAASDRLSAFSGGGQHEHSLDVPGHGDEAPFAAHGFEAAERKLAEAHHRFDDPEHRLGRLLAKRIELSPFGRLQPMCVRLDRRRLPRRRRRLCKAFVERRMMRLTAHGDDRLDARLLAGVDVVLAEIARVRQERLTSADATL